MLSTIVEFVTTNGVREILRVVSMEVALACFAATIYFTLSGQIRASPKKGKGDISNQKTIPHGSDQPSTSVSKALRQGDWEGAIELLKRLPASKLPASIAPRVLMAAAKASNFDGVIAELKAFAGRFEARSLEAVTSEAYKNKDAQTCMKLHAIAVSLSVPMTSLTLEYFAKALAYDVPALRTLVESVESPLPKKFAQAVLEACAATKEVDLASEVFDKAAESDAEFLRNVVEKAASGLQSRCNASLQHAKEIRQCAKNKDCEGALRLFELYSKGRATSVLYNSVIDACLDCAKLEKAAEYFGNAVDCKLADVVTYNIMIKGCLSEGDDTRAKQLLAQLLANGLTPTHTSYHTFLSDLVQKEDARGAWKLLDDMQAAGVSPNAVTYSILLKMKSMSASSVHNALKCIEKLDDAMDDVLFSSLAEACIRTRQWDSLSAQMAKLSSTGNASLLSAQTYGSMIKAYGQLRDTKSVWRVWTVMESGNVQATAITLGCMIEALVINGRTTDAWELAKKLRDEETTCPLVNTVIYTTILKGFANMKQTDRVMTLYEEMKSLGIHPNLITYNTVLNAFAQTGSMHRASGLLEDMKTANPPVEPDIVTYSTIIKGFCHAGSLDQALDILKDMQSDGNFSPDEVMYNSLLDGCAKAQRPDEALKLLDNMRNAGIAPSNYTLSILVKLMGRCKRLNKAFSMLKDLSSEYGLKANIQVYTCLIQACFNNRQAAKAVALHDQIIDEGLYPDEMTYSALVSGCLKAGLVEKAVHLVKCAHGVAHPRSKGALPGVSARCLNDVISSLGGSRNPVAVALVNALEEGKARKSTCAARTSVAANAPWRS